MLRAGPQASAQVKPAQQQQQPKQKKRLSFKDPEVDSPQQQRYYTKPATVQLSNAQLDNFNVDSRIATGRSFEAIENPPAEFYPTDHTRSNFYNNNNFGFENLVETVIDDSSPTEEVYPSYEQENFRSDITFEDYSSQLPSNMRCPPHFNNGDPVPIRNNVPLIDPLEEKVCSSTAQHQIQLLKYQLDQQNQQTQLAFHQVQLLTDQMEAECAARRKAQEQNNLLMNQNQSLLKHIEKLFQQIEELEKQIQFYESERRSSRIPHIQEPQGMTSRGPFPYSPNRRMSSDAMMDKAGPPQQSQVQKRSSLTPLKTGGSQYKINSHQPPGRREAAPSPKPYIPSDHTDTGRTKDTLHIGDMSPPVHAPTSSPLSTTGWKTKPVEQTQPPDTPNTLGRTRTGSFSSYNRLKPPDNIAGKSGFNTTPGPSGIGSRRYSSSTSDLYNTPGGVYQPSKSVVLEDTSARSKSSLSTTSASSKLPRYQAYTGWQSRRNSLVKDYEATGKEKSKYSTETSLQHINQ